MRWARAARRDGGMVCFMMTLRMGVLQAFMAFSGNGRGLGGVTAILAAAPTLGKASDVGVVEFISACRNC